MTTIQKLDKELFDNYRKHVVPDSLEKIGIYSELRKRSENSSRMTENEIKVSRAIEDTLGIYLTVEDQTRRGEMFKYLNGGSSDEKKFLNVYSLFAGCSKGVWLLNKQEMLNEEYKTSMGRMLDEEENEINIFTAFMVEYNNLIRNNDGNIIDVTAGYLDSVIKECKKKKELYPKYAERVEDLRLEENSFVLEGFKTGTPINGLDFEKISFDDIIGNQDAKDELKSSVDKLLFYDPENGKNFITEVCSLPNSILLYGDPGEGKTLLLKATATYASERAKKLNKPLEVVTIDDKIKSKYHGESSKELRKRFDRATDPKKIGLLYIEDIESLFPSRKELEDEPEDKDTFRTLINMIQGLESRENNGNYLIVATTNFPDAQDDALAGRFNSHINVKGPETIEEYAEITKNHLEKHMSKEKIRVDDWSAIGEMAKKKKFSGRDISNFTTGIVQKKSNITFTDNLYELDPWDAKKKILSQIGTVSDEDVMKEIENYSKTLENEKERAREMKIEHMVKRREMEREVERIMGDKK